MSPADSAEVQAWVNNQWHAARISFTVSCSAAGRPIDPATAQRMGAALRQIAENDEHVGLTDLQVLRLAYDRVRSASVVRAARATKLVLWRVQRGAA